MRFVGYVINAIREWNVLPEARIAGLIALPIVLGVLAIPGYRIVCGYHADESLEAAKVAARNGDWVTARDQASRVLEHRQDDFDAYRIWAKALAKLGGPLVGTAAGKVLTDARATRDDRLEALRVVVAQAPQALALDIYKNLSPEFTAQAAFRAAVVPLRIQRGESELAEKELREVVRPGDGPDVHLELLRVLCSRQTPERVAEARQIFSELVAANAIDQALEALPLLGSVTGGLASSEPLPDLPTWLSHQPKAKASHHLLGINPAIDAQPTEAAHWYETAVGRFLASDPGPLGAWLIQHGQVEMAARVLEKHAASDADAYLVRLRALLLLEQRPAIEAALRRAPASVDFVEVEMARAKFAMLCANPVATHAAWTRAEGHAAFDTTRNRLIEIARTAMDCHDMAAAADAWVEAIRLGWGPLPLYGDLRPIYASLAAAGRSEDLLEIFRVFRRFEPSNAELQNHACYLGLIHAAESPDQVATATLKLIGEQECADFYVTLMLAEMLDGRGADALACLPKLRDSKDVPPMMVTGLEGTAQVLSDQTEAGTGLLKEVDWRSFMPQERRVFRDLLVKHKISGQPVPGLEKLKFEANAADHLDKDGTRGDRESADRGGLRQIGGVRRLRGNPGHRSGGLAVAPRRVRQARLCW